ncbi:MAG: DUF58 domain-containing protein [Firmicutes bacterium]|nr:DUF58 domain-containing protein [Bacillota bacterium]
MNWWKLYLWLCLLLIPFFPAKPIYLVFVSLAIVYWGGGKVLDHAFRNVKITRTSESTRLFPGEIGRVSITFENGTILPLAWLSGHDHLPLALEGGRARRWVISLGPFATEKISYSIIASGRGFFTTGPLDVSVGEPLGLHQFSTSVPSYHNIVVYPRIYELVDLGLPSRLPHGNIQTCMPIFLDHSRLAGVRPYQAGDQKQSIHWKLTARTGELQVKQFQHTVAVDTVICLNLNADDYTVGTLYLDSELAIETAASLGNHLAQKEESFGLVTNGDIKEERYLGEKQQTGAGNTFTGTNGAKKSGTSIRLAPRKGMAQLMSVLEALARLQYYSGDEFSSLLTQEAGYLPWGAVFLIIVPTDSPKLIDTAQALVRRGYRVLIFVVGSSIVHPQLLHRSTDSSLQLFRVRKAELGVLGIS